MKPNKGKPKGGSATRWMEAEPLVGLKGPQPSRTCVKYPQAHEAAQATWPGADVATARAKAIAINLIIRFSSETSDLHHSA